MITFKTVNLSSLNEGIYFIEISNGNNVVVKNCFLIRGIL
ncbi:T9SS type A sorting domain-containing protein [Pontimicrobium aquaticum]|uniref:T9SS type A sorting domain-containing protein n=1 Tax=Pontimicrobium aquaticum TaxID=2565367 RepID=A0A4U0EUE6_9FLAO|nr:T9SS type A sorting domain-containing protein [Pontimicrobium aquaticum]